MSKFKYLSTGVLLALTTVCIATTGCTSKYNQESTGQYIDSSLVTGKVKSKLMADDLVPGANITVKTYKNTVQLSGFVSNQYQKARAIKLAKQVPGVLEVKDALVIKR